MKVRPIGIKIIETTPEFVKVKLPFLAIPVEMDYQFFKSRLEAGYFILNSKEQERILATIN